MSELIKLGQAHSNNFVDHKIEEDGFWGHETKKQGIRCVQRALNLDYNADIDEDGIWGPASDQAFGNRYVKRGETQYMVTALQILFYLADIDPSGLECPGIFGSGLENAVKCWQTEKGLDVDCIAGKAVFGTLMDVEIGQHQNSGNSRIGLDWQGYDPNNLPNFGPDEFRCECGCGGDVCDDLKIVAQLIRDHFGSPVTISSGYRCEYQNRMDGGVPDSLHRSGEAIDIYLPGLMDYDRVDEIAAFARSLNPNIGTIRYHQNLFVHVQMYPRDQVWN